MRVIAGTRRSLPLKAVPGNDTRPTTDRIKETLFNMLGPYIPGCRFLDLFAGSGGIGIEALSRGAEFACFVEKDGKAVSVIRENLKFTKFTEVSSVIKTDVMKLIGGGNGWEPYDVIFLDPPYHLGVEKAALEGLADPKNRWLSDDGLIVIEAAKETDLSWTQSCGCEIIKEKCYKTNKHLFIRIRNEE